MRILFVTSTFNLNGGGISSYAHDFCLALNDEHEITVLTGDDFSDNDWNGVNIQRFPTLSTKALDAHNFLQLIKNISPDIIVNSKAPLLSLVSPFINNTIRIISISHFVDGILADIAGFNTKYIDSVINLSDYGGKNMLQKYGKQFVRKMNTLYNFIPSSINLETKYQKYNNDIITIVYPGGGSPAKSPDVVFRIVISLLKTNYPFKFYWLGDTILPAAKYFKLKSISTLLPKDNRLVLTGRIQRDEALSIIQSANIFLLPSRGEGCPISLMEAMSVGTIPIVSDSPHASVEIIQHQNNGFIYSIDKPNDFTNKIIQIIKNKTDYLHIYTNSRKTAQNLLSQAVWNLKMNELFHIIDHKKRIDFTFIKFSIYRIKLQYRCCKSRIHVLKRNLKIRLFFNKFNKNKIVG